MPQVSDVTKDTTKGLVGKLFGLFRKDQSADLVGSNTSNSTILSGIYKLIFEAEVQKQLDFERGQRLQKTQDMEVEKRHQEIIKALSLKRFKTPKRIERKIEEVAKEKPVKETKPEIPVTKPTATPTPTTPPQVSTTPVPSLPSLPTASKIITGAGLLGAAATVKAKIAGKESAGTSDKSYNIMNIGVGEKSGRDNVFNLTTMTIPEVINLAEERGKKFNRGGMGKAAGKYQFMPATLKTYAQKVFKDKWSETKYTPENQELLMDALINDNAETLRKNGVPVSDITLYAMHFTGSVEQSRKIATSPDNTSMREILSPIAQKANPKIAEMTVGGYRDWLKKGGFNFQNITIVPPQKEVPVKKENMSIGNMLDSTSAENSLMKKEMNTSQPEPTPKILNNVSVSNEQSQKTTIKVDDRSPYERKKNQ